jgi:hypothetical protein
MEERDSEGRGPGEELEREDMPESAKEAIKGHGSEGRAAAKATPDISEEGEHGQTQVPGDPGEAPDEE